MLAKEMLKKIGFTNEMRECYNKYKAVFGDKCDSFAKAYMREGKDFNEARAQMRELAPQVNVYTADMIFILECTGYAYEDYLAKNIDLEIFYDTMKDITYKVQECKTFKGVYGIFVPEWFKGFLRLERFGLGRLQYDLWEHREDTVMIGDFKVEKGFKTLACHIPSSGPLTYEAVVDSFKRAYNFFQDRQKDGILLIECFTWLLFPEYSQIFKECAKNTYSFAQNFELYDIYYHEKFFDCWRIFNVDIDDCVIDDLPEDTRMQKGFKKYLKENNKFGGARGCLLFDGENILTRKE
ncbi:MAG: hypothetical protein E7537_04630 [Ruminococcaceae bacterium]|nr:hypothetical protein [Oscillospiraceae bacterium]